MLVEWRKKAEQGQYADLLDDIVRETDYLVHLDSISKSPDEFEERQANINEVKGLLADADFNSLTEFLTDTTLSTDLDRAAENDESCVTLLTLHASKGLEFPNVFITGLEDGLLPHSRSHDTPEGLAEERRLLYVGITRTENRLYLTRAFRRRLGRYAEPSEASRFLYDLPPHLISGTAAKPAPASNMPAITAPRPGTRPRPAPASKAPSAPANRTRKSFSSPAATSISSRPTCACAIASSARAPSSRAKSRTTTKKSPSPLSAWASSSLWLASPTWKNSTNHRPNNIRRASRAARRTGGIRSTPVISLYRQPGTTTTLFPVQRRQRRPNHRLRRHPQRLRHAFPLKVRVFAVSWNSVRVKPGHSACTCTPVPRTSAANPCENAFKNALVPL